MHTHTCLFTISLTAYIQLAMQEMMNGKMMPYHPGMPHHALVPPHNAYIPVHTMSAAIFAPRLSPISSVLMTPKFAGTLPSHSQFISKQLPFILHHPVSCQITSLAKCRWHQNLQELHHRMLKLSPRNIHLINNKSHP